MLFDTTKCKCWKRSFEPPKGCFDYCTGKILRFMKPDQMITYLHLDESLATKIFELTSNDRLINFSDFEPFLTQDEYHKVEFQVKNISEESLEWIRKKIEEEMFLPV